MMINNLIYSCIVGFICFVIGTLVSLAFRLYRRFRSFPFTDEKLSIDEEQDTKPQQCVDTVLPLESKVSSRANISVTDTHLGLEANPVIEAVHDSVKHTTSAHLSLAHAYVASDGSVYARATGVGAAAAASGAGSATPISQTVQGRMRHKKEEQKTNYSSSICSDFGVGDSSGGSSSDDGSFGGGGSSDSW